jgi:hypothetical protein
MKVMGRRGQGAWAKAGLASSAGERIRLRRVVFIWLSFDLQPDASVGFLARKSRAQTRQKP